MLAALVIALTPPWLMPVSFGLHAPGWHVGQSGTHYTRVGREHRLTPSSTAWAANVRCPDCGTSDPPNTTLRRFPRRGIVVRASIQPPDPTGWPPSGRRLTHTYSLRGAYHFPCCEAARIGGAWEMYGFGPRNAYSVIISVYWGSRPRSTMLAEAQRAIRTLHLPRVR